MLTVLLHDKDRANNCNDSNYAANDNLLVLGVHSENLGRST